MTPKQKAWKKWYESHKDSCRETKRLWNKANRDKIRTQSRVRWRRWFEKNKDKERASQKLRAKKYCAKHRDRIIAKLRDRYWSNPEKWRKYSRTWSKKNPEKIRQHRRKRYATNAEHRLKVNAYNRKREAQKLKSFCGDVKTALCKIAMHKTVKCFYCHKSIDVSEVQIDHVRPLSKGGAHAAYNLVPACASCNCSKRAKPANDFINAGQLILVY